MKRARPQGLGPSAAKKEKADADGEQVEVVETTEASTPNEKIFYELPENATALDQLRALFDSATMFLGKCFCYYS